MEPSDIDEVKGGETPGEMLRRLMAEQIAAEQRGEQSGDLDAIASAFKAAVLAGEV